MNIKALKGEKVHQRSITVESFAADNDRIVLEGTLNDTRHIVSHNLMGKRLEPGLVHGMVVRFLVGEMPPRILDAEVEIVRLPLDECASAAAEVKKLIGIPIVYGFSRAVKERLGGKTSCTHLTALVLSMGSAAMQGIANNRGRTPLKPETRAIMVNYVKDSCYVWREDGGLFRRLIEEIHQKK